MTPVNTSISLKIEKQISCLSLQKIQPQSFHACFKVQSGIKLFFTNTMSILFIIFSCHHNFVVVWTVSEQLPSFPWVTDRAAQQDKSKMRWMNNVHLIQSKTYFSISLLVLILTEKKFPGTYFCGSRTDTGRWAGTRERSSASSRSLKPGNKVFPPVRTMFW